MNSFNPFIIKFHIKRWSFFRKYVVPIVQQANILWGKFAIYYLSNP